MNDSLSSPSQQGGSHGLSLSSSSPLKRLERLSDDIKIERDKATNALQEKARLKIEMESLKQQLNNQIIETTEYRKSVEASDTLIRSLKESLNELRSTEDKLRSDIKISNINNEELESYNREQKLKYQSLSYEMELLNDKLSKLQITNDGLDGRIQAKDQLIDEYKDEISRLKKTIKSNDDKVNLITQALNTSVQSNEELKLKARKADNIHQTYMQLLKSYDDLKREYESVSISNETLDQKLKDSIITLEEKDNEIENLKDHNSQLKRQNAVHSEDIRNLEIEKDELTKRVVAEAELASSSMMRADVACKGKEFIDQQLDEYRKSHSNALDAKTSLEQQLNHSRNTILSLQNDLSESQKKIMEMEGLLSDASKNQAMASEVELLRNQLSDIRKKLLRREMEEEGSSTLSSKAIIEREQQSRAVYESIILELRTENDKINSKNLETLQKMEDLARKANRVDQLEEEVQMYKDTARMVAVESQSVALSASEAAERSVKSAHDKNNILRDLRNHEIEIRNLKSELNGLKQELADEKAKHKLTHLEKLSSERKAAEFLASKSRLEAIVDDLKAHGTAEVMEVERMRRQLQDYTDTIDTLRQRCTDSDKIREQNFTFASTLQQLESNSNSREKELLSEISLLKQVRSTQAMEIDSLTQSLDGLRKGFDAALLEIEKIREESIALKEEKERIKREMTLTESTRTEIQLSELKKDLDMTINDWRVSERDRTVKEDTVRELNAELCKERERTSLLKTQVSLLDERLRVSYQELSVFRSLDVYHKSYQAGMNTTIKERDRSAMDISATPILGESYSRTPSSSMWLPNPVTSSIAGKLTLADMTPSTNKNDDFDIINDDDKDDIVQEQEKQPVSSSSKGLLNLSFQAKLMKEATTGNQEASNDNNNTKSSNNNTTTNTNTNTKSTYRSLKSDFERARKLLQSRGAL